MTLVEKIARALWELDIEDRVHREAFKLDWYKDSALASLRAMREPTESLSEFGSDLAANGYTNWRDFWQAMIDQAIKEGE